MTIAGNTSYGAKISLSIAGISIQPSEFVKILFVFFVAGMLYQDTSFQRVCVTTVIAAIHVLILVASRDLGAALLFFVTYVVMLYVATKKVLYFAGGLAAGSAASVVAYHLFSHIRVRVRAWQNPLAYIDKEGYQISQSLFAIGTGGWFGMGLYQGLPDKIPVVKQDFIFSAVSEELGGIFALCLIMVCFSCFLMFLNIAMQMKDQFYKLVALGLGTIYAFQVFLTIGGVTKFIPSTGVTLPLVSYGGSSLLSSMIIFAVIQGLYILRQDEGEINASKSRKNRQNRKKTTGFENADIENSRKNNREFTVITYAVLVLFVCMMGYFAYFQFVKSEDFINSPYNKRQDLFARKVTRGEIISADGRILAETITDTDGTETRYYPYANMFAHVVGFSTNGKSGLESIANFNLLRSHTMTLEKVVNELQGEKNIGDNVVTTLNYDLQDTAYEALGKYDGAIVVMEPSTGKILAMVSKPDYDPNNIAEDWDELTAEDSESSVLLNRATQGLYPPGSVFKIFTTLEYVHENSDYEDYSFDCNGKFTEGDSVIHCYKNKRHGQEDLIGSFADSCNSSFASLGLTLNPDSFTELCDSMLFNTSLPLRFESSKSSFSLDADADVSTVLETSIGQGKTLVTPMAYGACCVSNRQ